MTYLLWRKVKSGMITASMVTAAVCVLLPLVFILIHIVRMGAASLDMSFFTAIPSPAGEPGGGMANGIAGSGLLVLGAGLLGVPVGILGAVYLSEFGGSRISALIRFSADVLAGVPSIITGMVVYGLLVVPMKGFSALAGAFALSLIMVPIVLRTTEEQLKLVPTTLREASLALGTSVWRTTLKVTLPSAAKGVITGILLAVARIAGETAPLLFTALGNQFWSRSPTEPIAAMPLQIFNFAISPYEDWRRLAWAGALVLVTAMLVLNLAARFFNRSRVKY